MAILTGRWDIDYSAKRVYRDTSTCPTVVDSVNALYSALQDEFDEPAQMDDLVPMSAQTPTEYTMINGWFIDDTSIQYLDSGALKTSGWANSIIVAVPYSASTAAACGFQSSDIGETLTACGDTGVILDFNQRTAASVGVVWLRPTDSAADLFDNGITEYTVSNSNAAGSLTANADSGESLWPNIYTLGTLEDNTDIYVAQENDLVGGGDDPPVLGKVEPWWGSGQIDILVKVQESGSLIDSGEVLVFARQYSKTYDNFEIDLSAGGRNAVPLATGDDLNNTTGYRSASMDAGEGTFVADEIVEANANSNYQAIVTAASTGASPVINYYLIGASLFDFANNDNIIGQTSGASGDVNGAPADFGPAADTGITVTFGATLQDINNGNGDRPYSVIVDVNGQTLLEAYERTKYLTRRGASAALNGQEGQFYLGIGERLIRFENESGSLTEGERIITTGSAAEGVITARHDLSSACYIIVRTVKGTFAASDSFTGDSSGVSACVVSTTTITPTKAAPFGTFAGGTFFGARGVFLDNVAGGEATNYQLTDASGVLQQPPNVVTISVTGLAVNDRATVFVLDGAGGSVLKTQHTMTAQGASVNTVTVDTSIPADTPASGAVRVVDTSASLEQRYRYSSFSGSVFTLVTEVNGTADAGGNASLLVDAAGDFTAASNDIQVGDLFQNNTDGSVAVAASVLSASEVKTTDLTGGGGNDWGTGDTYTVHATDRAYTASDTAYVPIVDAVMAASGTAENTLTYSSDIPVTVRVRQGRVITPFTTAGTVLSGGLTVAAIRTTDTIASS